MANKYDIERSIIELKARKSELGARKAKLQNDVSETKEMLRTVLQNHPTHTALIHRKKNLVAEMDEVELEIIKLKKEISKRSVLKSEAVGIMDNPQSKAVVALTTMRDEYQSFASDKTRVSSMRIMASQVAERLTEVIKNLK